MKEDHWYKKAKIGVFYHWGIENGRRAEEFEKLAKNWNAKRWIDAAKKLHADYITFATFHSDFSWLVTWKTEIPGLNNTKRDFLGELIKEANAAGIKIIVYITSATINSKGSNALNCIDYDAYNEYRGVNIKSSSYLDFQRYIAKDVIMEIMDTYPDVAGFWYDGWNDKAVCEEVFKAVHDKNPNAVNIRNDFYKEPYQDEDVMAQECLAKFYCPEYDKASASWLESGVISEWCNTPFECWDTVGTNTPIPCNKSDEIKHAVSILSNGWVDKIGLPSNIDGTFADFVYDYLDMMDGFLTWSNEALCKTVTGGFIGGNWSGGAYGFTTQRPENNEYYICVTTPPQANSFLSVINNGFNVRKIINLRTGENVEFECNSQYLTIKSSDWSEASNGVMIFKVEAEKKSIGIEKEINPKNELPNRILIELDESKGYSGIEIIHRDASAIAFGAWGGQYSQRPKKYALIDAKNNKVIAEGIFNNQRGAKWISLKGVSAKKMYLEILSGYDSIEKSYAAGWMAGWRVRLEDVTDIASNKEGIIQFVDSKHQLWERSPGADIKIADNIKFIKCGNDNNFYYIDLNNKIIGGEIDEPVKDIEVLSTGELFYVTQDATLKKGDCVIMKNVRSITTDADDVLYIASEAVYKYKDNQLEKYEIPYNTVSIASDKKQNKNQQENRHVFVVTPTGKIHVVNELGDNSFITGYDAQRVNSGQNGMVWYISKVQPGLTNVEKIRLIEE